MDVEYFNRLDGWYSSLTNIGTSNDKRTSHQLRMHRLPYQTLINLRRLDDMGRKAVELVPATCFREGYEITIGNESAHGGLKEDLEQMLFDLDADAKIEEAMCHARAYGGAAILIGANDGRPLDTPLDVSRVRSVDFLNVLEPIEIYPYSFYGNVNAPKNGEPEYYQFNRYNQLGVAATTQPVLPSGKVFKRVKSLSSTALIHESRLIIFDGGIASRYQVPSGDINQFWGDSIFLPMMEVLRDYHVAWAAAGLLATDIGQPVISIEGLLALVGNDAKDLLRKRMQAIELSRSAARAILIDTKEKYERQTTNLSNVPELLKEISGRMAAAVDIPLGLLAGYGSSGVGQTGDVDLKNHNNRCRGIQWRKITPVYRQLLTMGMRSLRKRGLPKKYGIRWRELDHQTDAERAESRRVQSQTDIAYIRAGVVTPDEIRKARFVGEYSYETTINESKDAPGFLAPLPPGLLPKSMSAEAVDQAIQAGLLPDGSTAGGEHGGGVPGKIKPPAGPAAGHAVSGYNRRNPSGPAGGIAAPTNGGGKNVQGEDAASRTLRKDAADAAAYPGTAAHEAKRQRTRAMMLKAKDSNAPHLGVLEQLAAIADAEAADCAAGTCGPDCTYDHPWRTDEDGTGVLRTFAGLRVVIESPKGTTREWVDSDGTVGTTLMKFDYGYVEGTLAADGDSVDVYLGPDESAGWVYCIHQMCKAAEFATYDEDKCLIGWSTPDAAIAAYNAQYDDPRFFGGMSMISLDDFKAKLAEKSAEKITTA